MVYACTRCGEEFKNEAQGEFHITQVHGGKGELMEFETRGEKVGKAAGRAYEAAYQEASGRFPRTRGFIRREATGGGITTRLGVFSRTVVGGFRSKVKARALEIAILWIAAIIATSFFGLIWFSIALILLSFYLILPNEYEIMEKARRKAVAAKPITSLIQQIVRRYDTREINYYEAVRLLEAQGLSDKQIRDLLERGPGRQAVLEQFGEK